jgi:hypothetical protein
MKPLTFLFIVLMSFTSCKKDDEDEPAYIDFTYSGNYAGSPATVTFSASPNIQGDVTWDFGDGTTGTGSSVSHVYVQSGFFKVVARVDNGSTSASKDRYVNVSMFRRIMVSSIRGVAPSLQSNATTWDPSPSPAPDLYFRLYNTDGSELVPLSGYIYYDNSFSIVYPYNPPMEITNFENNFKVQFIDNDPGSSANDMIGSYNFLVTDFIPANGSFPSSFTRAGVMGDTVTVNVTWAN